MLKWHQFHLSMKKQKLAEVIVHRLIAWFFSPSYFISEQYASHQVSGIVETWLYIYCTRISVARHTYELYHTRFTHALMSPNPTVYNNLSFAIYVYLVVTWVPNYATFMFLRTNCLYALQFPLEVKHFLFIQSCLWIAQDLVIYIHQISINLWNYRQLKYSRKQACKTSTDDRSSALTELGYAISIVVVSYSSINPCKWKVVQVWGEFIWFASDLLWLPSEFSPLCCTWVKMTANNVSYRVTLFIRQVIILVVIFQKETTLLLMYAEASWMLQY